jgi:hypothetical protein
MDGFAVAAERGMADALRAVVASGAIDSTERRDTLTAAIRSLAGACAAAGTVRDDVAAPDVLATLTGVFLPAGAPEQRDQAKRMLDLVMDGLRAPDRQRLVRCIARCPACHEVKHPGLAAERGRHGAARTLDCTVLEARGVHFQPTGP